MMNLRRIKFLQDKNKIRRLCLGQLLIKNRELFHRKFKKH